METFDYKFDYISEYGVISEGYSDPPIWATYGSDDPPEYIVERGYIVKHNGSMFKIWHWIFIRKKLWKVEKYDPRSPYQNKWSFKGDYESLILALDRVKELAE